MPRIQGLAESGIKTSDVLLKSGEGYVFSITIAWKGVTVGDILATIKDGLAVDASDEVAFIASTANGTLSREWAQGKKFDTGIFLNIGPLPVNAMAYVEMTFK